MYAVSAQDVNLNKCYYKILIAALTINIIIKI